MKRAERQITIEGTPSECYEAMLDYESFPDWQRAVKSVEILSRDRKGRAKEVEFEIDAKVRTVRYTLDYSYEEPSLITWRYVEGDVKDVDGEMVFEAAGEDTTLATYALRLDAGMWLPGKLANMLSEQVMHGALEDLKKRVESR